MIRILLLFFSVVIFSFSEVFVWSKFYNSKVKYNNIMFYFVIIILSILGLLNHLYVNAFIKVLLVTILMIFCNWLVFRKSWNESIVSTIYGQFILAFADGLGVLILIILLGKNTNFIKSDFFDTFAGNLIVSVLYVSLCLLPFIKSFYCKLISLTRKLKVKNIVFVCLLVIVSINFLMATIYYDMKSIYVIIINSVLLLIYSFIVYRTIDEKNINLVIKAENDSLMESLSEYENMVDRQRIDNHENKNQLLIIKNMIKKNDKNVIKYIDTVVKDEKEDDEALYTKVKTIPSGGLQGIIYQKMLVMKSNGILFSLDVSRDVRKIELEDYSMEINYKLCKIIGVLLDNAIEETLKIKDKCIMISLYVDECLVIEISNKFDGNIDFDRIDDAGYTTKGSGHGYGLALVKKLISETDIFENEKSISKDIFKQVVKVKLK